VSRGEGCPVGRGVPSSMQGIGRYLGSVDVDFYCAIMGERSSTQSPTIRRTLYGIENGTVSPD
jgi:hypothetical protein